MFCAVVGDGDAISVLTYVSRGTIMLGKLWGLAYAKVISNANIVSKCMSLSIY